MFYKKKYCLLALFLSQSFLLPFGTASAYENISQEQISRFLRKFIGSYELLENTSSTCWKKIHISYYENDELMYPNTLSIDGQYNDKTFPMGWNGAVKNIMGGPVIVNSTVAHHSEATIENDTLAVSDRIYDRFFFFTVPIVTAGHSDSRLWFSSDGILRFQSTGKDWVREKLFSYDCSFIRKSR